MPSHTVADACSLGPLDREFPELTHVELCLTPKSGPPATLPRQGQLFMTDWAEEAGREAELRTQVFVNRLSIKQKRYGHTWNAPHGLLVLMFPVCCE